MIQPRYFNNDRRCITVGKIVFLLFVARQKPGVRENPAADRVTRRCVHKFTQGVELRLAREDSGLVSKCPDPTKCSTYHPLLKHSRSRGNPALRDRLLGRFGSKGGGFCSTKDEANLLDVGVVSKGSKVAQRATSEFLMRYLAKASGILQEHCDSDTKWKSLNFCMDAARVCQQQAPK